MHTPRQVSKYALRRPRHAALTGIPISPLALVENNVALASSLTRVLFREGYEVTVVATGETAVEAFGAAHFDVLVLDIELPDIDGFEVLQRLRASGQSLPVLVLSARDAVDDRVRGLDLGADDYMCKPFALRELTARVHALRRRGRLKGEHRIVHGPLVLDSSTRSAFLGKDSLTLPAREWSVLKTLLGRVERIVSKETIIEALTGIGGELSPNAIEVYISRLRAKLEPAGIPIRTVRGLGYILLEYRDPGITLPVEHRELW